MHSYLTIKQFWIESDGHSGNRNLHLDLIEAKVACSRDRVLRLMRQARIRAAGGYRKPEGNYGGKPHLVAPNVLDREFEVGVPGILPRNGTIALAGSLWSFGGVCS